MKAAKKIAKQMALSDITERKQTELALQNSERELTDFFEQLPLGLLWVYPSGDILRVNQAELELLGCTEKEVVGQPVSHFHVDPKAISDLLKSLSKGQAVRNFRARVWQNDKNILHVLIDANGLWEKGCLVHSRWFIRDITRLVKMEREILAISEREQQRIGQDLHDGLSQLLTGIKFLSESLARDLAAASNAGAATAMEIYQNAREALTESRDLARGLSPVSLEAKGLMNALHLLARRVTKVFRCDCCFKCRVPVLVSDHLVGIHLYRIAQEAVSNAINHGKASEIEIELRAQGNNFVLGVRDDGIGIKPGRNPKNGLGLRIMQYRASVIGGSLMVQKRSHGGTEVVCTVKGGIQP